MKHFLRTLRVIFHPLAAAAYIAVLAVTIGVFAFSSSVLDKSQVQSWISDAEIYDKITPIVIDLIENPETQSSFADDVNGSNLQLEEFEKTIDDAYPPSYYFTSVDNVLSSVYDRLENGESEDNRFAVAASDRASVLSKELESYLKRELKGLKACSDKQLENFGDTFDPFTIICQPSEGFSLNDEIEDYADQLMSENSFLTRIAVDQEDVFANGELQATYDSIKSLRVMMPILLIGLVVLFIISSVHPFAAMRNLGYLSIVVSVFVGIVFLAIDQFANLSVDVSDESGPAVILTAEVLVPIIQNAIDDIAADGARMSIYSTLIGIILIALHYIIEKTHVGEKLKSAELYRKFAGSHAVSIADISVEANKSKETKEQILEDLQEVKEMKELANDDEHTVEEIAKKAATKKKKPAVRKTQTTSKNKKTANKSKTTPSNNKHKK